MGPCMFVAYVSLCRIRNINVSVPYPLALRIRVSLGVYEEAREGVGCLLSLSVVFL